MTKHVRVTAPERHWLPRSAAEVKGPFEPGNLWKWIVGMLLAAFVLGYLLVAILFFPGFGHSTIVTVPDLRNKPLDTARRAAERSGLKLVPGQRLKNPTIPAGAVLVQSPLAGQEVTRGAEVRVVLSAGPERRPVPDIQGLSLQDAQALLVRHGFTVRLRSTRNDADEGTVLGVYPATGVSTVVPSIVTLFVSAGPPKVPVPEVVTLPLPQAQARLQAVGLRLGSVSYDSTAGGVLGGIIRQRPGPGDSIARGRGVSVTVAGHDPRPPAPVDTVRADTAVAPVQPAPEPTPPQPQGR